MNAAALIETVADPFAAMRAMNKMRVAGFALRLESGDLIVSPFSQLSEQQRAYIRAHKAALVYLLADAEILHEYLVQAGPAGLAFREGTPADWSHARLLAAGEVLYADGRMVNRNDRRYLKEHAPPIQDIQPDISADMNNVIPMDREAYEERAAIMEYDAGLPRAEAERKALALTIRDSAESSRGEVAT